MFSPPLLRACAGDQHYHMLSALQKSVRGSDHNASLYWLTRMLMGGEDPKVIARRLIIMASEDIGKYVYYSALRFWHISSVYFIIIGSCCVFSELRVLLVLLVFSVLACYMCLLLGFE